MRRALVAVAAALVAAGVVAAKLTGAFGDDAARTVAAKLAPKSATAESFIPRSQPRLPSGAAPDVVAPAADDGFRASGTTLDDELDEAVRVWGESACTIVSYIETLQSPPTWDGLMIAHGPAGVRAFSQATALYEASRNLGVDEPTLDEIREFWCAARF